MKSIQAAAVLLRAQDILLRRGGVAVIDIPELAIERGRVVSLIGPNGAGKSTLMLALASLLKPHQGTIYFHGQPVDSGYSRTAYRRKLAMVFQEPLLFDATVFENVATGLKIRGMKKQEIDRTVEEQLARFGINHLAGRSARKLSGGEAQRASLARAFAIRPEIIFLDEPFASLDPPTRDSLVDDLHAILRQTRTTAVIATHDRMEALRLSDIIAVMFNGTIVQTGTPEEVMNRPADEQVASFVGTETILSGTVTKIDDGTFSVSIAGAYLEAVGVVTEGEEVVCCIRPELVTISTDTAATHSSARNTFAGTIVKISPLGLFYKVQIDCGFPLVSYITRQSLENLELKDGKQVAASFKATAVHVIRK
jgi:tungstate transport system ATP-binding protein